MVCGNKGETNFHEQNYTFYVSFKDEDASFDSSCCKDTNVVFFKPQKAEGQYPSIVSSVGLSATPDIEAGFYLDLTVRTTGCPKKNVPMFKRPIAPPKIAPGTKVGSFLKS